MQTAGDIFTQSVKEMLIKRADDRGICRDGHAKMKAAADIGALVDYYVANPDWCLERNFPDMETLRTYFAGYGDKGVYVDRVFNGELLNERQTYILHGCRGTVRVGLNVGEALLPMIYVANGCHLTIMADEGLVRSVVPVYVFGENEIRAEDGATVKFRVFKEQCVMGNS